MGQSPLSSLTQMGRQAPKRTPGVEPVVQPVIPLPTPKLPKRDYKAIGDGERTVFGPGTRFDRKSLKVWVDGERADLWSVYPKKGTFELWSAAEEGAVVQADYARLVKRKFKRTSRGNGSDDFYIKLPKSISDPRLKFTVRADSPYGCSAYVYVRDHDSWEPQDELGMSFDGRKTKTRTQTYSDLYGGRNRIWVSTNCPWTLTISQSIWK